MAHFSIAVIINTHKNPTKLKAVLHSFTKQTKLPDEIIVAEDGIDAATQEVIKQFKDKKALRIKHVNQEHNGYRRCHILNKAIRTAESDYLVFMDGDCVAPKKFVQDHKNLAEQGYFVQGRRCFIKEEAVDSFITGTHGIVKLMLTGKMYGLFKGIRWPFAKINIDQKERGLLGCNLAIWKKDLETVNGYDEDFTGWGKEDSDVCFRLYHLGRKRKFVYGRAYLYHLDHPKLSRAKVETNQVLFDETKKTRKVQCINGLISA